MCWFQQRVSWTGLCKVKGLMVPKAFGHSFGWKRGASGLPHLASRVHALLLPLLSPGASLLGKQQEGHMHWEWLAKKDSDGRAEWSWLQQFPEDSCHSAIGAQSRDNHKCIENCHRWWQCCWSTIDPQGIECYWWYDGCECQGHNVQNAVSVIECLMKGVENELMECSLFLVICMCTCHRLCNASSPNVQLQLSFWFGCTRGCPGFVQDCCQMCNATRWTWHKGLCDNDGISLWRTDPITKWHGRTVVMASNKRERAPTASETSATTESMQLQMLLLTRVKLYPRKMSYAPFFLLKCLVFWIAEAACNAKIFLKLLMICKKASGVAASIEGMCYLSLFFTSAEHSALWRMRSRQLQE